MLDHRLRLSGSGRLSRPRCVLRCARGGLRHPRRLRDPESLGCGGASQILGAARLDGATLLFFLPLRGQPFVFLAALLVAALLFFPPLGRASLLLLAPPGSATLFFFTPLLLEPLGFGGAALGVGGAIRSGRARGLLCGAHRILCRTNRLGGALALRRTVRSGYPRGLLRCAHRFLGSTSGVGGTLRFTSAFGLGGARGFLSGAHRFLRRTGGFGSPFGFERSIRFGLLLRESLRFSNLTCLFGGASGLFGRALRLLCGASRFRRTLRF